MTINEITKEQEAAIPEFIKKWTGENLLENDRPAAERSIEKIYEMAGLNVPQFIHTQSPKEAIFSVAVYETYAGSDDDKARIDAIRKNIKSVPRDKINSIRETILYSQWFSSSAGWFEFAEFIGVQFDKETYDVFHDYCKAVFACIPYENVCFVIDKPIEAHFEDGHLHREDGPAVLFGDGYGSYSLNGVKVSEELVMTPPEDIDVMDVLKTKNAEVRREIVRKIGVKRLCKKLNSKTIDKMGDYELLVLDIPDMTTEPRYLKMKNPSIGTWHVEGVPPNINTCQEALTWRTHGFAWNPKQLT